MREEPCGSPLTLCFALTFEGGKIKEGSSVHTDYDCVYPDIVGIAGFFSLF